MTHRISSLGLGGLVAVGLLLATSPPGMAGVDASKVASTCLHHGLPDVPAHDDPTGDEIYRLAASGEDLLVDLIWSDDPGARTAIFTLTTPTGETAGSWDAPRVPGTRDQVVLPGALEAVPVHGRRFRLELTGGGTLRAATSFHVTVLCGSGPCGYGILPSVEAHGAALASGALWDAIAAARAAGASDLFDWIRQNDPSLAGEIAGFVDDLGWGGLDLAALGDGGCHCGWVAAYETVGQDLNVGLAAGAMPRHRFGQRGAGALFRAGAQTIDGFVDAFDAAPPTTHQPLRVPTTVTQATRFGLHLLCVRKTGDRPSTSEPTDWPSQPEWTAPDPVLEACEAPCMPRIDAWAKVAGCAEGRAFGQHGESARVDAGASAHLTIAGQLLLDAAAEVDDVASPARAIDDVAYFSEWRHHEAVAEGVDQWLETTARLGVEATQGSVSEWSYARGGVDLDYELGFQAAAACKGVPPVDNVQILARPNTGHDGGVVSLRDWGDPP